MTATAGKAQKKASSWSSKVGTEVGAIVGTETADIKAFAEKAGLNAARLRRQIEGQSEWDLADFCSVANALDYTPGGFLARCLK